MVQAGFLVEQVLFTFSHIPECQRLLARYNLSAMYEGKSHYT